MTCLCNPRTRPAPAQRGFTLLELLVVISIIALLISMLMPALGAAREASNLAKCLTDLRELGRTSSMYMEDNGLLQPWHFGFNNQWGSVSLISEHVFGGFKTTVPHPKWGIDTDMYEIPTSARPYNKYLAPGVENGPIKSYICPSDKNNSTPNVNDPCQPPEVDSYFSAWTVNGTSYSINWYWMEGPPWLGNQAYYTDPDVMAAAGKQMLRLKVGGAAAKFVIFMENSMNSYMLDARPPSGAFGTSCLTELGNGWHRKFSKYAMAMLDGHAEYHYVDARYSNDNIYDIWPERNTARGF